MNSTEFIRPYPDLPFWRMLRPKVPGARHGAVLSARILMIAILLKSVFRRA